jgi:hypothetical protein
VVQSEALRTLGFLVDDVCDLPSATDLARYHAIVIVTGDETYLPMLAAHLRAQRHFGRRALIALAASEMADRVRREAVMSGFDAVLPRTIDGRTLAATVLRRLRPYPEHRCALRPFLKRRSAA